MTNKQQGPWEITLSGEEFERLKQDERFWAVLTLARTVNALRFVQVAGISEEDTPSAQRQRMNSFLFLGAILYEGLLFARSLGEHFSEVPEFKEGFGRLFEDKAVLSFSDNTLRKLRKKFVFHFDKDMAPEAIRGRDLSRYAFASGTDRQTGNAHYRLADVASLYYLFGEDEGDCEGDLQAWLGDVIRKTTDLSGRFGKAAEELIAAAMKRLGAGALKFKDQ